MSVHAHHALVSAMLLLTLLATPPAFAADPDPNQWQSVVDAAKGQTVSFNAWGGEPRINAYIAWAGIEVEKRFGVKVSHVKLADTSEAVSRVLADKAAGANEGGAIDLIWINGENFAAMKKNGLLFGPWSNATPNFALTDPERNKDITADFTVPVDGLESPWGRAQVVFYHDMDTLLVPPKSMHAILAWCKANPGRFAYPRPPDFLGLTFLKQTLLEIVPDRGPLYGPVESADFDAVTAPLWDFLDRLHPVLWRQGQAFPANATELRRLFADKETRIGFTFNPGDPSAAVANNEFPPTVESFVLEGGTIGNVHFLAIPFNAANKAGAMVLADFLLSPEAQARKLDPAVWGDQTVLNVALLPEPDKALFDKIDLGRARLRPAALGTPIPEPHPSWMTAIEAAWAKRYTAQ